MKSFNYTIKETPHGIIEFQLSGSIDESTQFPDDFDFSNFKQVHFDFERIEFINSEGIKLWIQFVDSISENHEVRLVYSQCTPLIVNQINIIDGFLPKNAVVDSVFIPVSCELCDRSLNVPLKMSLVDIEFDSILDRVETDRCNRFPVCKSAMEVDVIKEYYFRFTNR